MSTSDDRSDDRADGTGGTGARRAGGPLGPSPTTPTAPAAEGGRRARREGEREEAGARAPEAGDRSTGTAATGTDYRAGGTATDRASVVAREKDRFGGVKVGSAFFGWVAATGMAVVLVAVLGALGLLVGAATGTDAARAAGSATDRAASDPATAGLVSVVALLVVVLVSYFCGGYVAGRMARFDGLKQGVAVWLWAVVIAAVVAVVGLLVGNSSTLLSQVTLPTVGSASDLTTGSVLTVVAVAVVTLVGAVLGGLAGMRFHRRVDKAGLGH